MALWEFISKMCVDYNIDDSHGLQHAQDCVVWVCVLHENLTSDELIVAIYAAALHDMCDKKYMNVSIGIAIINEWLITQKLDPEHIQAILNIISTMSYTYLKSQMVNGTIVFPDHGIYNNVYHLVRHADLLDAYKVNRCILYQQRLQPNISKNECLKCARTLFDTRVFKYVSDGWITLPNALLHVPDLTQTALHYFESH
jgi:hypothetical protein